MLKHTEKNPFFKIGFYSCNWISFFFLKTKQKQRQKKQKKKQQQQKNNNKKQTNKQTNIKQKTKKTNKHFRSSIQIPLLPVYYLAIRKVIPFTSVRTDMECTQWSPTVFECFNEDILTQFNENKRVIKRLRHEPCHYARHIAPVVHIGPRTFRLSGQYGASGPIFLAMRQWTCIHISAQTIDCGYLLEPSQPGYSNEYPQSMFF